MAGAPSWLDPICARSQPTTQAVVVQIVGYGEGVPSGPSDQGVGFVGVVDSWESLP
jgi:hypothetical protein